MPLSETAHLIEGLHDVPEGGIAVAKNVCGWADVDKGLRSQDLRASAVSRQHCLVSRFSSHYFQLHLHRC